MAQANETRGAVGAAGLGNAVCLAANSPENSRIDHPPQENLLLEAIKALSAREICADAAENIPLTLAASGWRSTAAEPQ